MATKRAFIEIRRATLAEFNAANPVLKSGEPAHAYDANILKIGNGVTAWASLTGVTGGGGGITIADYGDNRLLTSDGTSTGINGESLLTFDGTYLNINSVPVSISGHKHISTDISDFNTSVSGLVYGLYASLSGATFTGLISSPSGSFSQSLKLNDTNVSVVGHTHSSSDITNFATSVSGLINNGYGLTFYSPVLTGIPLTPTAATGTNTHQVASTSFVRTEISNLVASAPSTLDTLNELATALGNDPSFATTVTNSIATKAALTGATFTGLISAPSGSFSQSLKFNGTDVSVAGHTHTASNITDFNTSVSGLLPTINTDNEQPQGFINSTDSTISFNNTTRVFTIAPTGTNYGVYIKGLKYTKTTETITIPNTDGIYYIYFATSNGALSYKTTFFDFSTDVPIAYIYWNVSQAKAVFFAEERHGIKMDTSTHYYLHRVFGTQYISGLSIGNYTLAGDGSSNTDATFNISDGVIFDEDILVNITNSASPANPFEQILSPTGQLPIFYRSGSNGTWYSTTANSYAVKTGATAQYNLNTAGTWSIPDAGNKFIAMWIVATNNKDAPILSIMGQIASPGLSSARNNQTWGTLDLAGLPIVEFRPLYRLIFETKSSFTNVPKASLSDILDLRSVINTVQTSTQNDHGSLYGLADDDHLQYVHIDTARTISANHTLTNGITFSGSGTQTSAYNPNTVNITGGSGDFLSLKVGSVNVSVSGHSHVISDVTGLQSALDLKQPSGSYAALSHTHTASNITDFNTSVSGLLPVKNIIQGSNITVTSLNGEFTINSTATGGGGSSVGSDLYLWANFR